MDDEAIREEPGGQGRPRSAEELEAARGALEEARRQIARGMLVGWGPAESLGATEIAYQMELAEHRSTTERAHRAELAARELTIEHQQARIDELEAEVGRLRTALQVLIGLVPAEAEPLGQVAGEEQ
jgi:HAMP domain-containing protein